ncbi:hypothetical protein [Streptomyces sp. NPDC058401]
MKALNELGFDTWEQDPDGASPRERCEYTPNGNIVVTRAGSRSR